VYGGVSFLSNTITAAVIPDTHLLNHLQRL